MGFTEAEGCFKIKPRYREGKIISFRFEFEIHLHIDDLKLLDYVKKVLKIGNVYANDNRKSCSFVVGSEKALRELIKIFDGFPLNGIKILDFIDFKEAFLLYFNREGTISEGLKKKLLELKEGLNTGRVNFTYASESSNKYNRVLTSRFNRRRRILQYDKRFTFEALFSTIIHCSSKTSFRSY